MCVHWGLSTGLMLAGVEQLLEVGSGHGTNASSQHGTYESGG